MLSSTRCVLAMASHTEAATMSSYSRDTELAQLRKSTQRTSRTPAPHMQLVQGGGFRAARNETPRTRIPPTLLHRTARACARRAPHSQSDSHGTHGGRFPRRAPDGAGIPPPACVRTCTTHVAPVRNRPGKLCTRAHTAHPQPRPATRHASPPGARLLLRGPRAARPAARAQHSAHGSPQLPPWHHACAPAIGKAAGSA